MQGEIRRGWIAACLFAIGVALGAGTITVSAEVEVPGYELVRTEHLVMVFDDGEFLTTIVTAHEIITVGGINDGARTQVAESSSTVTSPRGKPDASVTTVPEEVIETVEPTTTVRTVTVAYDSPVELASLTEVTAFDWSVGDTHAQTAREEAEATTEPVLEAASSVEEAITAATELASGLVDEETVEENATFAGDPVSVATGELLVTESDLLLTAGRVTLDLRRTYRSSSTVDGSVGRSWAFPLDSVILFGEAPGMAVALGQARAAAAELEAATRAVEDSLPAMVERATAPYRARRAEALAEAARAHDLAAALGRIEYTGELADLVAAEADRQARAARRIAGELEAYAAAMRESIDRVADEVRTAVRHELAGKRSAMSALLAELEAKAAESEASAARNARYATGQPRGLAEVGPGAVTVVGTDGVARRFVQAGQGYEAAEPTRDRLRREQDGSFVVTEANGIERRYGVFGELRSIVDRNGNGFTFHYEETERIVRIADSRGRDTVVDRGPDGRIVSLVAPDAARTRYGYDRAGRLVSVTDPAGDRTTYSWEGETSAPRLVSVGRPDDTERRYRYELIRGRWHTVETIDEEGAVETFDFSVPGRTRYTNPSGLTWTYHYDERNRTIRVDHPGDAHESFTYDPDDRLRGHRRQDGALTAYEYDGRGNLTTVRHPDGTFEAWAWSADDLLLTHVERRGSVTRYEYDARGNLATIIYADGTTDRFSRVAAGPAAGSPATYTDRRGNVITYRYDEAGFLAEASDLEGLLVRRGNDALGRPVIVEGGAGGRTAYRYRADGLLASVTGPDGLSLHYEYSSRKDLVGIEDAGRRTSIRYDARHLPLAVTNPAGEEFRYEWRPDESVIAMEVVEADGRLASRTQYSYDARGLMSAVSIPAIGSTTRYEYDAAGRLSATVDPTGSRTEYATTFDGRLASRTRFLDDRPLLERYEYHPDGPLRRFTDASGASWSWTHDPVSRTIVETTPDGSRGTLIRFDPYGLPLERTDGSGRTRRFSYDARGRLTAVWNDLHREVAYAYDEADRVVAVTDGEGARWELTYDARDRLVAVRSPDGSSRTLRYAPDDTVVVVTDETGIATRFEYDAAGRLAARVTADGAAVTRWNWSVLGAATMVTDPTGRTTRLDLDAAGRVVARTDPAGAVTSYEYDAVGRLLAAIDPTGRSLRYAYDELGRLVEVRRGDQTEARYAYDAVGRLLAEYDGLGHAHRYEYDAPGRLVREINRSGAEATWRYGAAGRVVSSVDFNGIEARYAWDPAARLERVDYSDGSFLRYGYDRAGRRTSAENRDDRLDFGYDPLGRLSSVQSAATGADLHYAYDAAGRLTGRWDAQGSGRTDYLYDDRGLLVGIDDPAAGYTRLSYDAAGRRTGLLAANGVSTTTRYDAAGHVAAITVTDASGRLLDGVASIRDAAGRRIFDVDHDGALTAYAYDGAGRLARVSYPFDGPKREADLLTARAFGLSPQVTAGPRHLVDYLDVSPDEAAAIADAYRMLAPLRKPDTTAYRQVWSESFSYDEAGNRASWRTGWGEVRYTYDGKGRLASAGSVAYSYDMAGNLTEERGPHGVTTFDYSPQNRVRALESDDAIVTFRHDPLGRRISRTSLEHAAGGSPLRKPTGFAHARDSIYRYEGMGFSIVSREERLFSGLLALDIDDLTKPQADGGRYDPVVAPQQFHGLHLKASDRFSELSLGLVTLSVSGPEGSRFLSHDVLGSPRVATSASGAVSDRFAFDAYGSSLGTHPTPAQPYGFNGKPHDPASGLYDYGFRDYAPLTGRFVTPDPIRHGANWYAYVEADPVNFVDPLGLAPVSDREAADLSARLASFPAPQVFLTPAAAALSPAAHGLWENMLVTHGHTPAPGDARVAALIAAQDRVMADTRLAPGAGGPFNRTEDPSNTWCNVAACYVAAGLGIDTKYLVGSADIYNTRANEIGTRLALQASWVTSPDHRTVFEVTGQTAQQLANRGNYVVASWINPHGDPGHVATVRPQTGPYDPGLGPLVANVGAFVDLAYTVDAFGVARGEGRPLAMDEVKYYLIRQAQLDRRRQ